MIVTLGLAYWYQPLRYQISPRTATPEEAGEQPKESEVFQRGDRVLVVVGHPDDSEFYVGATLLKMNEAGLKLRLLCLTSGDKGYYPFGDPAALRKVREAEQTEATSRWGGDVIFPRFPDGRLAASDVVVNRVKEEILAFEPDTILTFDPLFFRQRYHRDHVVSGEVTLAAVRDLGWAGRVMLFHTTSGRFAVDITDRWDDKADLIRIHRSQFGPSEIGFILNLVKGFAERDGRRAGMPLAEMFRVLSFR